MGDFSARFGDTLRVLTDRIHESKGLLYPILADSGANCELGYPTLQDLVKHKQHRFYHMWLERRGIGDDPLYFTMRKVISLNTPVSKLLSYDADQSFTQLHGNTQCL
ncbi:hypothetical protein E2C01_051415 [Portunus trituberculatus]|uniref:Uncharacterized protein n=1 Tax=Portunus trituberculatus TaxID=210409 RepID=A0A5B7GJ53_PORTR|nr:hypothetical protein [Portunus trituberculatus]